jgi:processive 1,2-diacylglycerol beta-glucosyltransferase
MRTLIISASTGAGHNAAATALGGRLQEKGHTVETIDFLKDTYKILDILVGDGYEILATKFPVLYGLIYETFDIKAFNRLLGKRTLRMLKRRLRSYIQTFDPHVIVSTHPFVVGLVANLKASGEIDTPFVSIVTDFKAHYAYIHGEVDHYITGSPYTSLSLMKKGVPPEKVHAYGIPVPREFAESPPERKMHDGRPLSVLIMGGSMGVDGIEDALDALVGAPLDLKLTVVCGKNEKLKTHLEKLYRPDEAEILGFITDVRARMDAHQLIVTKPGGLTTTEALYRRLPMIIPYAIPGQETENLLYLTSRGMAIAVEEEQELKRVVALLDTQPALYDEMVRAITKVTSSYSMEATVDLIETLGEKQDR